MINSDDLFVGIVFSAIGFTGGYVISKIKNKINLGKLKKEFSEETSNSIENVENLDYKIKTIKDDLNKINQENEDLLAIESNIGMILKNLCEEIGIPSLYNEMAEEKLDYKIKEILNVYSSWHHDYSIANYLNGGQQILHKRISECLQENNSIGLQEAAKLYVDNINKDFKKYK